MCRTKDKKVADLKVRPYNFLARRKELAAKKKNNTAKAMAAAISQWAVSRFQERRAAFSQINPKTAKAAPTSSRKSCFRARQKRWKLPLRGTAAGDVAAEDISAS
jgi:hypothetical protein